MRLAILSVSCLLTACFTEPSADRVWKCSVDQPLCPEGQTCVNDWCAKDGIATPDLASGSDGMLDMSMVKPCVDGFPLGTQGVWACRGKFSPTTTVASSICQNGYKLCADGYRLTDAECSNTALKGFFFGEAPGKSTGPNAVNCAVGTGAGWGTVWFGCGSVQGASLTERANLACRGFFPYTLCYNSIFVCDLNDGHLDKQKNEDARNGVLCCPP